MEGMTQATDLPSFIRSLGVDKAAEVLDESPRAVKAWLYGERVPRKQTAQKIVKRSEGKVSFAGIYGVRAP